MDGKTQSCHRMRRWKDVQQVWESGNSVSCASAAEGWRLPPVRGSLARILFESMLSCVEWLYSAHTHTHTRKAGISFAFTQEIKARRWITGLENRNYPKNWLHSVAPRSSLISPPFLLLCYRLRHFSSALTPSAVFLYQHHTIYFICFGHSAHIYQWIIWWILRSLSGRCVFILGDTHTRLLSGEVR